MLDFFHAGRIATSAVWPEHKTSLWPAEVQRGPNQHSFSFVLAFGHWDHLTQPWWTQTLFLWIPAWRTKGSKEYRGWFLQALWLPGRQQWYRWLLLEGALVCLVPVGCRQERGEVCCSSFVVCDFKRHFLIWCKISRIDCVSQAAEVRHQSLRGAVGVARVKLVHALL